MAKMKGFRAFFFTGVMFYYLLLYPNNFLSPAPDL